MLCVVRTDLASQLDRCHGGEGGVPLSHSLSESSRSLGALNFAPKDKVVDAHYGIWYGNPHSEHGAQGAH